MASFGVAVPNELFRYALPAAPEVMSSEDIARKAFALYQDFKKLVGEENAAKVWRSVPDSKPGPKLGSKRASTKSKNPVMLERYYEFASRPENRSLREGTAIRRVASELEQDGSLEFGGSNPTAETIMQRLKRALKAEGARKNRQQSELAAKLHQFSSPLNALFAYGMPQDR